MGRLLLYSMCTEILKKKREKNEKEEPHTRYSVHRERAETRAAEQPERSFRLTRSNNSGKPHYTHKGSAGSSIVSAKIAPKPKRHRGALLFFQYIRICPSCVPFLYFFLCIAPFSVVVLSYDAAALMMAWEERRRRVREEKME